jgi:cytochrome c oxidase cbb3-type subunit I/II
MATESRDQAAPALEAKRIVYNDSIVRWFIGASVVFGVVAMLVGVIIALQLAIWQANVHPILTFGRLRPLHTNAAIFAFVGNMIFAGIYYSTQRLVKARLASDLLAKVHFWGWQLIIVSAAVTLPLGITTGKEYAELEWPIDIAIALIWVVFAINFFWTLAVRREKHLYVAIWFYIATIMTVAVLHIVNSLEIPVSILKSYSIYGGAKDALIQWWYGHNAVAFFLTTPVLGIMYYFVPKAAGRPVYSYRLSVVHFWALVFLYIWAGPHHLLNSSLPNWAQTLGMIFSVMLWAPSWGGMINGLLTLRGAWDKLREDPVLKFLAAGVTFYGMSTFEGPLLSIKSVNGLAHYTDWIIGHVHSGALGWNGFMAAGMFYYLVPKLFDTKLHSKRAADLHFWIGTIGILLYMVSMWVAGVTQGMMWRAQNPEGGLLYPNFVETLMALRPMYWTRIVGGALFLTGQLMMAWNLFMTAKAGKAVDGEAEVLEEKKSEPEVPWTQVAFGRPVLLAVVTTIIMLLAGLRSEIASFTMVILTAVVGGVGAYFLQLAREKGKPPWHNLLEGRAALFTVLTVLAVLVGGIVEIVPSLVVEQTAATGVQAKPYRPLELSGRDIYLREGCYVCHSQMIRPFRFETARYGEASTLEDSRLDHPFQWGSKRTGPDLAREGGKYPNLWHYKHMIDPRQISPGSNMPPYAQLATAKNDEGSIPDKMRAMRAVGVPYTPEEINSGAQDAKSQASEIVADLKANGVEIAPDTELVALISFLQRLGRGPQPPAGGGKAPAVSTLDHDGAAGGPKPLAP